MECQRQAPLQQWHTFRAPATASYFVRCTDPDELPQLRELVPLDELPLLPLGSGSNVLFAEPSIAGVVLRSDFRGVRCVDDDGDTVCVEAAAGEPWHAFVFTCLRHGWYGLENLALIPGTVGAAPVHNIGAYGVEVAQYLEGIRIWESTDNSFRWLSAAELGLGYRCSRLRQEWFGRVVITHVRFRLHRAPVVHAEYPELMRFLRSCGINAPSPYDVFRAVCMLRRRKLPDPALVPNAGSFFKNPLLPAEYAAELQRRYPDMPCFPHESGLVKIPAGWLLERCGWKGKWLGNVGTWKDHALVIVTDGTATGQQIVAFARRLWASVLERFGIALEPEVLVFPPQAWQSQLSSSGESDVPTAERNATVL